MLPLYHRCNYADPFRFPSRLCWANDRSLLRRTFAATKEVSPHDRNENGGLTAILENEIRVRCRSRRSYFYHSEPRSLAREKPGGGGSQFLRMVRA